MHHVKFPDISILIAVNSAAIQGKQVLRCQQVTFAGCVIADDICEMTRSVGQTRYTRFDKSEDNENLVHQICETVAIGDAGETGEQSGEGDVRLLDAAEVAKRLHVSQSLVYKMIERRQLPAIKIGRCVRVDPRALGAALQSQSWAK